MILGSAVRPRGSGDPGAECYSTISLDSRLRGNEWCGLRRSDARGRSWFDRAIPQLLAHGGPGLLVRRVFHVRDCLKLDIDNVVADFFHAADVDVLNDVAGRRINRDGSARTLPLHPLGSRNQGIAIRLAACLPQSFVKQVHAIITTDSKEIWIALVLGVEGLHEVRIHL